MGFLISHVYLSLSLSLLCVTMCYPSDNATLFVSVDSAVEEETSSKITGHMTGM